MKGPLKGPLQAIATPVGAVALLASMTGSDAAEIEVVFDCGSVSVSSSKDISNVVLVFEDGSEQKLDGLSGREGTFSGSGDHDGKVIDAVYVKSGDNASGEGPGAGEHFQATDQDCAAAQTSDQ